jgi:hypothetical protein
MKHVFYFFAIFAILYEAMVLTSPRKFVAAKKDIKGKKIDDYTTNQIAYVLFNFFYLAWTMVGLFSTQWMVFVVLLIISTISGLTARFRSPVLYSIDALISFSILLFMMINVYHLHIDLPSLIFGL